MKVLRSIGLVLFLFSFGLFLSLFFMSEYKLTKEIFVEKIKKQHQESLEPTMQELFDKPYSTSYSFAQAVSNSISRVNEQFRNAQQWDSVIYDDYTSSLTKASTSGWVVDNTGLLFFLVFGVGLIGAMLFILPKASLETAGIKNDGIFHNVLNNRGWIGILIGTLLIGFYVLIYFYDAYIMILK